MLRLAAIAAFCSLAGVAVATPLNLEPLVLVGQPYADMPGAVSQTTGESRINNSGQWVTRVSGNNSDGSFLGTFIAAYDGIRLSPSTTILFDENTVLGPTVGLGRYASINNHGQIATTVGGLAFDLNGNPTGARAALMIDDQIVVRSTETDPFGGTYGFFSSSRHILNDQGHLLANFDLFSNPFSTFETVIEFSPSESGYDQTVRMTAGMPLQDGFSVRGDSPANWGSFDLSNSGDTVIGTYVTNSDLTARGAIVVNGVIQRMSGPVDDFPDGNLNLNARRVAINDFGEFAYSGIMASSDWEGGRWAVFRNEDEIVWIDDSSDPLLAGYSSIGAADISITGNGDVIWQAVMEDSLGAPWTALFHNDLVIATSDPNFLGDALFIEGGFSFDISDNGQWIIFDTPHGIYRTLIPSPSTTALLMAGVLASLRRRR